jgi:pilus assembly protein CpaE
MAAAIQALVVIDSGLRQESVERSLPKQGIEVVGIADGLESSSELLRDTPSDILVVACAGYSERALFLIDTAVKQRPNRPVVVLAFSSPDGFMRRLFEMGADDVLELPQDPANVLFSFQKAVVRRQAGTTIAGAATGKIISVLGPKGGTGKTLTSTNLAVGLAQSGARTVLVDLDLQFGDIGLALGLSPERTMYDLMKAGPPFDHDKLDRHLIRHSSGVKVLIAPTRPDQASAVSIDFLRDVYASLRTMCDAVIVDTPPGFTPEVIATIDVSTIVGRGPDVSIPSDREIPRSINEGTPIVAAKESSGAAKAFRSLADRYARTPAPTPAPLPSSQSGVRHLLTGRRR